MTMSYLLSFFQDAIILAAMLSLPPLILGLIVGLAIAVFQAVTQINEQTLSFVPKLLVLVMVLFMVGPWMLQLIMDFAITTIRSIPGAIG